MNNQMPFANPIGLFGTVISGRRRMPLWFAMCAVTLVAFCLQGNIQNASAQKSEPAEQNTTLLTLHSGIIISGEIVKGTESTLSMTSNLFDSDLEFDLAECNNVRFPSDESRQFTTERFRVRTTSGDSLYGDISKLDDNGLQLDSDRHGKLTIARENISSIIDLENAGEILGEITDVQHWGSLNKTQKYWKIGDSGELRSARHYINLSYQCDLPDTVLIELTVTWRKTLDMVFGLGAPESKKAIDQLPRIINAKGSLVLKQKDVFATIYDSIKSEQRRLSMQIHWDRKKNTIAVWNENAKELCPPTKIPGSIDGITPGVYLENRKGDLQIQTLRISKIAAAYDSSKKGVQATDSIEYGELQSFDGNQWTVRKSKQSGDRTVAATEFRSAILSHKKTEAPKGTNAILRFQDGATLAGKLLSVADGKIKLQSGFSNQPVISAIAGIAEIRFPTSSDNKNKAKPTSNHKLITVKGPVRGQLVPGTGKPDDVIRWQPAGFKQGFPLANTDAKIVLSDDSISSAKDGKKAWPDKIYFTNKDTMPCRVLSTNEKEVVFDSFAGNVRVPHDAVKAVELSTLGSSAAVPCQDDAWHFSEEAQRIVIEKDTAAAVEPISENEIAIRARGRFGHSNLATLGMLKFNLNWKKRCLATLEVRQFVRNPTASNNGVGAMIRMWDNCVIVRNLQDNRAGESKPVMTPSRKAEIGIEVKNDKLNVLVNGKIVFSNDINPNDIKGNAVSMNMSVFRSDDPKQVRMKDISVEQAGLGDSSKFIDAENLEQLLTIPRLHQDNPPKQILFGRNFDLLRGNLLALSSDKIEFESRLDRFSFDRDLISSIVWLHAKTPAQLAKEQAAAKAANEASETDKDSNNARDQVVQLVMKDGRRLTVSAKKWTSTTFEGSSDVLGDCSVPVADIKELRTGRAATDATDIAYADWVTKPARAVNLEAVAASGGSGSSDHSPLVGTKAEDFKVKLLDGSDFKLSEQRGKVVVLDFWATWCGPCIRAMPQMIKATGSFDPDQVVFVALNQLEDPETIKPFLKQKGWEMTVGLDSGDAADKFQVRGIPQSVIIDKDGKIALLEIGAQEGLHDKMFNAIKSIAGDGALKK